MLSRLVIYVFVTGCLVFFIDREADRGTLEPWERGYLSWLSGNSKRVPGQTDVVHLILENTQADGSPGIFDQWPPNAIDYALILENLSVYAPRSVVVEPVLHWADSSDLASTILAEKTSELPALTLACVLQNDPSAPPETKSSLVPRPVPTANVFGPLERLPAFTTTLLSPPEALLSQPSVSVGFSSIDLGAQPGASDRVQLIARHGQSIVPSLPLAALIAYFGVDLEEVEIEVGSHIALAEKARIPIDQTGCLTLPPNTGFEINRVPADALFLDNDSREIAGLVSGENPLEQIRDSLVVLGFATPDSLNTLPATLATVQSAHYPTQLDRNIQHGIWGVLALLGLFLVGRRGPRLAHSILVAVLYITVCLLVFGTRAIWWPSAIPMTIILTTLLLGQLLPAPPTRPASAS